jgi:hypothetical protein
MLCAEVRLMPDSIHHNQPFAMTSDGASSQLAIKFKISNSRIVSANVDGWQ